MHPYVCVCIRAEGARKVKGSRVKTSWQKCVLIAVNAVASFTIYVVDVLSVQYFLLLLRSFVQRIVV